MTALDGRRPRSVANRGTSGEPGAEPSTWGAGDLDPRSRWAQVGRRTPHRLGQWGASIVFVVVVVLGLLALFRAQSERVEVLAVTHSVPAGALIGRSDLRAVQVAGVDGAVAYTEIETVLGLRAASGLVEGQVLTRTALSDESVPAVGQRLVALNLPPGRTPGGLGVGDLVDVLVVPGEGTPGVPAQLQAPTVLAEAAPVRSLEQTPEGDTVVTVVVGEGAADPVAAYSAAGQVTVVQAPVTATSGSAASESSPSPGSGLPSAGSGGS